MDAGCRLRVVVGTPRRRASPEGNPGSANGGGKEGRERREDAVKRKEGMNTREEKGREGGCRVEDKG